MIPRKIHFYWGNTTLPWFPFVAMRSAARAHPGWALTCWRPRDQTVYESGPDYFAALEAAGVRLALCDPDQLTGAVLRAYNSTDVWTQVARSDALRHWLLYTEGGFWSDTDCIFVRSLAGSGFDLDEGGPFGSTLSMTWAGPDVHTAIIGALPCARALQVVLAAQQRRSPAVQEPGHCSPFGPALWLELFHHAGNVPDMACVDTLEFMAPLNSRSYGYHCRGARIPWGSMDENNFEARLRAEIQSPDAESIIAALAQVAQ